MPIEIEGVAVEYQRIALISMDEITYPAILSKLEQLYQEHQLDPDYLLLAEEDYAALTIELNTFIVGYDWDEQNNPTPRMNTEAKKVTAVLNQTTGKYMHLGKQTGYFGKGLLCLLQGIQESMKCERFNAVGLIVSPRFAQQMRRFVRDDQGREVF